MCPFGWVPEGAQKEDKEGNFNTAVAKARADEYGYLTCCCVGSDRVLCTERAGWARVSWKISSRIRFCEPHMCTVWLLCLRLAPVREGACSKHWVAVIKLKEKIPNSCWLNLCWSHQCFSDKHCHDWWNQSVTMIDLWCLLSVILALYPCYILNVFPILCVGHTPNTIMFIMYYPCLSIIISQHLVACKPKIIPFLSLNPIKSHWIPLNPIKSH